jgi:hypothetical protein
VTPDVWSRQRQGIHERRIKPMAKNRFMFDAWNRQTHNASAYA